MWRRSLVIAAVLTFLSGAWFVVSVDLARRYGGEYPTWRYEPIPPDVVPPTQSEIQHLNTLCGIWSTSAACGFIIGAGAFLWSVVLVIRWLLRRKLEPQRGFEVVPRDKQPRW